jgi:hypothetical protein
MTEKPEASVLTARRAAQHVRLSSADDAYEHLYILTLRPSLEARSTSRWQIHRCLTVSAPLLRAWIHFPRAPEQFVTSPLCLVGYVRWDARSDRVPPLQTIIFSSFPGRTPVTRLSRAAEVSSPTQLLACHLQERYGIVPAGKVLSSFGCHLKSRRSW